MDTDPIITSAARSVIGLAPAVMGREHLTQEILDTRSASARGWFTPDEDDRVRRRFSQYLTARAGLLQTVEELAPIALSDPGQFDDRDRHAAFLIAYTAACLLIRAAKALVNELGANALVQRKLNEPEPRLGIPGGQYSAIYRSVTSPFNAWRILDAVRYADARRTELETLATDARFAPVLELLRAAEPAARTPAKDFAFARLRYRLHSLRRRHAGAWQSAMYALLEMAGRIISELRNPLAGSGGGKRVTADIIAQFGELLEPGDVLVTRHDDALTNLFLPGYWPHAALHVGPPTAKALLGVCAPERCSCTWVDAARVLEAKKDGVLLRALEDTLHVDAVAVIRPRLSREELALGISRALEHEGKPYDFDFDFFRTDCLVCTEVVYRAFDGLGPVRFSLTPRAGRPTLAAEDLLDLALEGRCFEPVAVYGARGGGTDIARGAAAARILEASYRLPAGSGEAGASFSR